MRGNACGIGRPSHAGDSPHGTYRLVVSRTLSMSMRSSIHREMQDLHATHEHGSRLICSYGWSSQQTGQVRVWGMQALRYAELWDVYSPQPHAHSGSVQGLVAALLCCFFFAMDWLSGCHSVLRDPPPWRLRVPLRVRIVDHF